MEFEHQKQAKLERELALLTTRVAEIKSELGHMPSPTMDVGEGDVSNSNSLTLLDLIVNSTAETSLLQSVFDTIPHLVFIKDNQQRFRLVNRAWCEFYGLEADKARFKTSADLFGRSSKEREESRSQDAQVLSGQSPLLVSEHPRTSVDGQQCWMQDLRSPLIDENHRIVGVIGISTDKTDQFRAEEARRMGDQRLAQVFKASGDAILSCDEADRIVRLNDSALGMFGYTRVELIETPLQGLLPDLYQEISRWRSEMLPPGESTAARKTTKHLSRCVQKNGGELTVEATIVQLSGAGKKNLTIFLRDISERMKSEEEVRASRRLLQLVIDTLPHYLFVKDLDSRYLLVNRAMADLFGGSIESFQGRHTMDFTHRPLEDRERAIADDRRLFSGEVDRLDKERELTFNDGRRVFLHSIKVPLTDESGAIFGMVGVGQDITLRKQAEFELRKSEERYRNLVESSLQGIIVNTDRILYANQQAANLFGYGTPEEILALDHIEELAHPDERVEMNARRVTRLSGGNLPSHFTQRCLHRDGTERLMELSVRRVSWEGESAILMTFIDRTEAQSAQAEALKNEQRFRMLVEGSIQGIFVHRPGSWLFANQALADIFGFASVEEIFELESTLHLAVPEERKRLMDNFQRRIEGEDVAKHYEFEGCRKDGSFVRVDALATVIQWDGQPAVLVTLTDITERHKAEEERRAGKQMLQDTLDSIPLTVSLKDRGGKYLLTNRFALDVFRSTTEDFSSKTISDLVELTQAERDLFQKADQQVLDTSEMVYIPDGTYTFRDGRKLDVQIHKIPMHDAAGEITGILTTSQDVTEQNKNEKERRRMATAMEQSGDAIFITDTFGVIEYVNPAFERITGYNAEEAVGQNPRLLNSGNHGQEFFRNLWETLLKGGVWNERYTNRNKKGDIYHVESTISSILDANKDIINMVVVQRDITPQIQMEEQLRRSQRMEAIGNLTGGIAHDFNNILVPILGYGELLSQRLARGTTEHDYVGLIVKAAGRASDLISQIMLFSRKVEGNTRVICMETILREVGFLLHSTLPKNIEFIVHYDQQVDKVLADFTQMHQVFMNLYVNAHHAMPKGGKIFVHLNNVNLHQETCFFGKELTGRYVQITVRDTGEGIEEGKLPHIFEPFYTTKEVGKGTGLGLSIVYGIVEQHGGSIIVNSRGGDGSTFKVLLPAVEDGETNQEDAEKEEAEKEVPIGGLEHILLVDDESENAHVARLILSELGYQVTAMTESRLALHLFLEGSRKFDMVITDHSMPHLTGLEMARQIRAANPIIPIILYTGHTNILAMENLADFGEVEILYKPYRPGELGHLVRRLLDRNAETKSQLN